MTPDVNLLVAAMREDHPHHAIALQHLEDARQDIAASSGTRSLVLLGAVVASFLRIVTHRAVFAKPSPLRAATDFIDALLASPGATYLSAGSNWANFRQLCLHAKVTDNLVPDAWIAAAVLQSGDTLHTFDRDFKKLLPAKHLHLITR